MTSPVIAEVLRGGIVESYHHGALAICDAKGGIITQLGDVERAVFPRSAVKAFQCVPVIESGAADRFGLSDAEICLCCASHNGEAEHVSVARSILNKAGVDEVCLECGAHWPSYREAAYELVRKGKPALQVHNNCSGKHAGMVALARHLNIDVKGYVGADHEVQRRVAAVLQHYCDIDISRAPVGIDGCSVPTWAMPLRNVAKGFAKLSESDAGRKIGQAVKAHPFLVAGTGRFDTKIMQAVPRLFIKVGAEGVFCGFIAHAGLGFALKCDDGGTRGAEVAIAGALAKLDVWTDEECATLLSFAKDEMHNWRKIKVGDIRAT